ncbi:MAG: UAA transporter [Pleopsidium flavum]|nr:MAG: UAA transporter [Pleopsidium flavum]
METSTVYSACAYFALCSHKGPETEDEEVTTIDNGVEKAVHEGNEANQREADNGTDTTDNIIIPDVRPDDAIFIPLGWARQCPRTFYKGSDPEWQSFLAFAQDRRRSLMIRNDLAGMVGQHLGSMRQFQQFLGQPMTPGKFWLDVDFPDGPPPDYERGGLEITDDYIAWSTRPVTPHNYSRLRQALWPTAISSSIWASYSTLWSLQVAKFRDFFNLRARPDHSRPQPPSGFVNFQRVRERTNGQQTQPGAGVEQPSVAPSPKGETEKASVNHRSSPAGSDPAGIFPSGPSIPQPGQELTSVLSAFKRTLARKWKPAPSPAPRGTCIISGLVELTGPRGMCVVDVRAAFHPGENRFVMVGLAVRRVQQRQQGPRGGPNMVTIPFHQVLRATTPVFTVLIYRVLFHATYSNATYCSLVPVIAGVGLATYGDYAATALGFIMTLLGALLAAVKTVTTNRIQTGTLRMSAMEVLHRMSPLALVQSLAFAYFFGEMAEFRKYALAEDRLRTKTIIALFMNGAIAFGLNIISFTANKKVGALTMTVAANVKQILTIVLSVAFFKLLVGTMHALGIVLTLLGAGWYAKVEMTEKKPALNTTVREIEEGLGTEK